MSKKNTFQFIQKEFLNASFLYSHILIPFGAFSVYCLTLYLILPFGVNKVFVTRSLKLFLPITFVLLIIYFVINAIKKTKPQFFSATNEKFDSNDLLLPLLPLTPVVQYIINNSDILSIFDIILLVGLFYLLACLLIVVIPRLFGKTGAAHPLMFMGLAFSFLFTNMALLSARFQWYENGSLIIQLLVMGGIWLISWLLFKANLRNLLYLLIAVNFVFNSSYQFINRDDSLSPTSQDQSDNVLIDLVGSREPVTTPSIYLMIYDGYAISDTYVGHGIDNLDQEQYLADQGFKIYPKTYSYWGSTLDSMGRVLNSSLSLYGNSRRATSGDGVVQNLFKSYGYKTYGVFSWDYFSRGRVPSYDYSFPGSTSALKLLVKAILIGELRFDLEVDFITQEEYIELKKDIITEVIEDPKFIYTHSHYPGHSQNSGVCRPNEIEKHATRLEEANIEMRQDLELIIKNDPGAIIIVAGDHGPCLTKTCTQYIHTDDYDISEIDRQDIQDRLGTFLAIKWPSSDYEDYDEIQILQDIFPAVFAYIFEDPDLLESKIDLISPFLTNISGIKILDGIIYGGINDGEALFP